MRKISAFLAIVMACTAFLGFVSGISWEAIVTSGLYAAMLLAAGIAALRGGELIYLAAAWALYVGMNLAAYTEVIHAFVRMPSSGLALFGGGLLTLLLVISMIGLVTVFIAHSRERRI